jgi:hypothetical protein
MTNEDFKWDAESVRLETYWFKPPFFNNDIQQRLLNNGYYGE